MKSIRHTVFTLLLLGSLMVAREGSAQQSAEISADAGTEYFISFPLSNPNRTQRFMGIALTSESHTYGTIEIPDVPADPLAPITSSTTRTFTVTPGEVTMVEVPRLLEPDYPGLANHNGEASRRAIRLTSRAPVSVSVINARQGSSGAFPALPVDAWGQSYTVTALPAVSSPPTVDPNEITSQLLITAAYDGTVINVYPSTNVSQWNTGERIRDTLNRGETWLLLANTTQGVLGSMDLSGTTIEASKPVGVVAGHVGTPLSGNPIERFDNQRYSAWHSVTQMPTENSLNEWGTEYVATPMREGGDRFRIIALQGTTVHVDLYDNAGNFIDRKSVEIRWAGQAVDVFAPEGMQLNGPTRWTADRPFMLTQIRISGGNYPNVQNSPALIRLVPTSRYTTLSVFALPTSIAGKSFGDYRLDLTAKGEGNPFEHIVIDGVKITDLPNGTISKITGNYWSFSGTVPPGGHAIHAMNGISFSGRVSGDNGSTPEGNVAITYELPHWSAATETDVTPPRVASQNEPANNRVEVEVTDRTQSYFSGVDEVAVHDSPGWERNAFDRPFDAELDAHAVFRVKSGVDPSGPLTLLLRDRDGNETTTQVHNGVCLQTAYTEADSVVLFVGSSGEAEQTIRFDANPCGDEAHIQWMGYDLGGTANTYLQDPVLADGGSLTYTISPNGYAEVRIRTNPNLPQLQQKTFRTKLELRIDDEIYSIPIRLEIDNLSGVEDEGAVAGIGQIEAAPNPFNRSTSISFGKKLDKKTRIEILDALGSVVREYPSVGTNGRVEWDGRDDNGNRLGAGFYVVRVISTQGTAIGRVLLVR